MLENTGLDPVAGREGALRPYLDRMAALHPYLIVQAAATSPVELVHLGAHLWAHTWLLAEQEMPPEESHTEATNG